jgi:fungal type III polyketide synthase
MAAPAPFGELNLSITGLGVQYPPFNLDYTALETLSKKFYPQSDP